MVFKGENLGKLLKEALRESGAPDAASNVAAVTPDVAPAQPAMPHAQPEILGIHQTNPTPDMVAGVPSSPTGTQDAMSTLASALGHYAGGKAVSNTRAGAPNTPPATTQPTPRVGYSRRINLLDDFPPIKPAPEPKSALRNAADSVGKYVTNAIGGPYKWMKEREEKKANDAAELARQKAEEEARLSPEEKILRDKRNAYAKAYAEFVKKQKELGFTFTTSKIDEMKAFATRKKAFNAEDFDMRMNRAREKAPIYQGDFEIIKTYDGLSIQERENVVDEVKAAVARAEAFTEALASEGLSSYARELYNHEATKIDYDAEKNRFIEKLRSESWAKLDKKFEAQHGVDHNAWSDEAKEEHQQKNHEINLANNAEITRKIVVGEYELLQEAKIGSLPPKEKSFLRKAGERWMSIPLKYRILLSSVLIGGFSGIVGGATIPIIGGMIGKRLIVSGISIGAAQLTGKGFNKFIASDHNKERENSIRWAEHDINRLGLAEVEKKYQEEYEEIARSKVRELYFKGYLMTIAGVGAGFGARAGLELLGWNAGGILDQEQSQNEPQEPTSRTSLQNQGQAVVKPRIPLAESTPKVRPLAPTETASSPKPAIPETTPAGTPKATEAGTSEAPAKPSGTPKAPESSAQKGASLTEQTPGKSAPLPESPKAGTPTTAEAPAHKLSPMEKASVVEQGEGVWHPVRRQLDLQLKENPQEFLKQYNLSHKGNITVEDLQKDTSGALKRGILDRETTSLLSKQGYINKDGSEMWVTRPGVSITLGENNHIHHDGDMLRTHTPRPAQPIESSTQSESAPQPATSLSANSHADAHIPPEDFKPRRVDYAESDRGYQDAPDGITSNPKFDSYHGGNGVEQAPVETTPSFARSLTQGAEMPKGSALNNAVEFSNYGKEIVHAIGLDFENMEKASVFGKMSAGNLLNKIPDYRSGMEAVRDQMSLKIENSAGTLELPVTKELVLLSEAIRLENLTRVTHQSMSFADLFNQFGDRIANRLSVISQYGKENF